MSAFGSGARVNAWFTINSFEKSAHLEKIDEDGMMNSVAAGTFFFCKKKVVVVRRY